MRKSTRALIAMAVLDLLLAAGAWWMIAQTGSGAWHSTDPAETYRLIGQTAGVAIGIVTVVLAIAFFAHRRAGN